MPVCLLCTWRVCRYAERHSIPRSHPSLGRRRWADSDRQVPLLFWRLHQGKQLGLTNLPSPEQCRGGLAVSHNQMTRHLILIIFQTTGSGGMCENLFGPAHKQTMIFVGAVLRSRYCCFLQQAKLVRKYSIFLLACMPHKNWSSILFLEGS